MVMGELTQEADLVVIGGGPGGYAAAFRAADLGLDVTLVDQDERPGGVCLFHGCIPSKTLLSLSELIEDARRSESHGIHFAAPDIDLKALRDWKNQVVDQLSGGLVRLCEKRGVLFLQGRAEFESSELIRLHESEVSHIRFKKAILATGSYPREFPGAPFKPDGRVLDSTSALALRDVPEKLLIIGGGYVALEMGSVYASLGSQVTLAARGKRLLSSVDQDLVIPLQNRLKDLFHTIHFETRVKDLKELEDHIEVDFEGAHQGQGERFDRVLVAIGRIPNSSGLGIENTKIQLDGDGFVVVDEQQRTTDKRIFAVGDVTGGALLAHKAMREGKVAAEVIAGHPSAFDIRAMPAVVYTDPQVAWTGLTEEQAKKDNRQVKIARFPWRFSGRAVSMGAGVGLTKILIEPDTNRIVGVGIVGREAEALVAEGTLAIEMGALADDVALTIHPHPTLSETEGEAAELFLGGATHILPTEVKG